MSKYQIPEVLILTALFTGCGTVMEPISNTDDSAIRISIAVGDTVRVLTKYGDRPTFEVTDITDKSLIGKDVDIRFADMAFLEKRTSGMRRDGIPQNGVLSAVITVAVGTVIVEGLATVGAGAMGMPSVP